MASPDPEKHPLIDGGNAALPTLRRRFSSPLRLLAYLFVFLAVGLVVFSRIQTTSCRGSVLDASFSPNAVTAAKHFDHGIVELERATAKPSSHGIQSRSPTDTPADTATPTTATTATAMATVLENFEVAQPVLMPYGPADSDGSPGLDGGAPPGLCTVLLMRHDFAWSYGSPFVGNYTPPSCKFNRVVLNFTVVSYGRQFDRLALMYFGDTEVWRTSTAEPTVPPGIRWVYLKDTTEYLYFWRSPQTVIFDLGNLIDDKYTGIFNTTLTATFFHSDVATDAAPPSDLIIPISARQGANKAVSQFTLPQQNATNTISFPRNARRAVFSLSTCGQASEEFWWSNVLESDVYAFNATAGELPGYSPFREVQVLIDGQLAGVEWPFPVIFTGGVSPGLHRPIASTEAFDLKEHQIDITAFLPLLCDGNPHTFTIVVAGLDYDNDLTPGGGESWYVTGKIFVWLDDDPASITTGSAPAIHAPAPALSIARSLLQTANGTNETLVYDTAVQRSLLVTARVVSQAAAGDVSWSQTLSYTNRGVVSAFGYNQLNDILIRGTDEANGPTHYRSAYTYPLFANQTYTVAAQGNLTIWGHVRQGKQVETEGASVFATGLEAFPGSAGGKFGYGSAVLDTTKEGTAVFEQTGDGKSSTGWGDARQVFRFAGVSTEGVLGDELGTELYWRSVEAVNGSVVRDEKRVAGKAVGAGAGAAAAAVGRVDTIGKGLFAQVPVRGTREGKGGGV
ncbi:peptide N-acetyl-beta-D-glucosaminyl asparaginase amidase A-domain-containing protein [Podospora appendiculata]|uniref:Peptide N-acetyl-beta-D-glucosaminyl asparaginase amidase A-domain-containing protein n=1 Tax=Podospora appendiculata TaxID=314037 RepID=A0AAE0X5T7_9PEZI|nr:peptide N-acetyl-beta-D-glucosaminyl asparaginase amidase A-domain-containing protein [Podospora appendiculata]